MTEQWVPVPDYEGRYDVSSEGRVRSWVSRNSLPRPQILSPQMNGKGYLHVCLCRPGTPTRTVPVHSLVLLAFVGPLPDNAQRRHLDGNPVNNGLDNLAYGSAAENAQDRLRHGRDAHARRTACHAGHPFTEANTGRRRDSSSRVCLACQSERTARNRART